MPLGSICRGRAGVSGGERAARNDAERDRKMEVQHDPERTARARPRDSDDGSHPPRHRRLHDLAPGGHERRRRRREHDRAGDRPGPVGPGQMRRLHLRAMIAAASLRVFLAVSLVAASLCPGAWASAWALDPSATRIAVSVRNLSVARVDGTFRLASGHVTLDDEDPSRSTIEAVIDAASVDTSEPKRDAHLRSADFLDVARYPTIAFRSTRIERADGGHWRVTGALTLLGRTTPALLDGGRSTAEGSRASAHASTTIERRDFGITYSGFAVGKQVAITIDAVGIKTSADAPPG